MRKQPEVVARCMELLGFVGLADQADEICTSLPHGSQRELCVAVALASDPTLLLLDEPLTGMNAEETASMIKIVKNLNSSRGTTTIVVEHNMRAVLGLCARTRRAQLRAEAGRGHAPRVRRRSGRHRGLPGD